MTASGEFGLIRRFFASAACAAPAAAVPLGIGDDCALLALPPGHQLAVSTDSLVAGVHFPDPCDPCLLGQRALATAASDLAAMGASPLGFTLGLSLPAFDEDWLESFARGLDLCASRCELALIGGDTTRGPLNLNFTVFGSLPAGAALTRSGAQPGDLLAIGAPTGEAAAALPLVLGEREATLAGDAQLLARYWMPQPQLALGLALRGLATAALDVSDGLLADVGHIAQASAVAIDIEAAAVPLTAALQQAAGPLALEKALSGGDDYVLAFTLPAARLSELPAGCQVIGRVRAGRGVQVLDAQGRAQAFGRSGYQHF